MPEDFVIARDPDDEYGGEQVVAGLAEARPLQPAPPSPSGVRAWALAEGHAVSDRGRVPARLVAAYREARGG